MSDNMMIPEGTFFARPKAWAVGLSKQGKEQAEVLFEITSAEAAGRTIRWFGSFASDKAEEFTLKVLRTCGLQGNDLLTLDAEPPPDVEVKLVITHEEYQGQVAAKVKYVNDPNAGGRVSQPLADNAARAFAARMKAKLQQIPKREVKQEDAPF